MKCNQYKTWDNFNKLSATATLHNPSCSDCEKEHREKNKEKYKVKKAIYREENREEINRKKREYHHANKEKMNNISRAYHNTNKEEINKKRKEDYAENREEICRNRRIEREKNKDKVNATKRAYNRKNNERVKKQKRASYQRHKNSINSKRKTAKYKENRNSRRRKRYASDPAYKMETILRSRLKEVLKQQGVRKTKSTQNLLGCTFKDFKEYLESLFTEGMTWENHGFYGWHVDHIIPCASFNLSDIEQQKICFHYTNLQPLWADDNWKKGSKII